MKVRRRQRAGAWALLALCVGSTLVGLVEAETRSSIREPATAKWLADSINPRVLNVQYAVRGPILKTALELKAQLARPHHGLPFDEIIFCNIGNPQALGQEPFEFYRQVLSGVLNPQLAVRYPLDVQARIKTILISTASGSIGAYTHSQGLEVVRRSVAKFIQARDNYYSNFEDIYLTNGASAGVQRVLNLLLHKPHHGVLIPIPQYPLYTATISLFGGRAVGYYLNESDGWTVDTDEMEGVVARAKEDGVDLRAIVVINPGNPTGNVMNSAAISRILKIAAKHKLLVLADEVYQSNIYRPEDKFVSFKKVLRDLEQFGLVEDGSVPLVSYHSTSKGVIGECGLRGGYFELVNVPKAFKDQIYKIASISLCPNTMGQVATELMVNPPKKGGPSYARFQQQYEELFSSMRERAEMISRGLNSIPGMSLQQVAGAMYAFPTINIPAGAIRAARAVGSKPDEFYCQQLLKATGIVTVPGSGFRQVEGTYHFRVTMLPPKDKIGVVVERIRKFHTDFIARYSHGGNTYQEYESEPSSYSYRGGAYEEEGDVGEDDDDSYASHGGYGSSFKDDL